MILRAKVNNEQHVEAYLKIWSGHFNFSDVESKLMKEIVLLHQKYEKQGLKEPFLSEFLFTKLNVVLKKLKLSRSNWYQYKNRLIAKDALIIDESSITVSSLCIPKEEITFKFEINAEPIESRKKKVNEPELQTKTKKAEVLQEGTRETSEKETQNFGQSEVSGDDSESSDRGRVGEGEIGGDLLVKTGRGIREEDILPYDKQEPWD